MKITLNRAFAEDCQELYDLQIASFKQLLETYEDYDLNPGAEKIEKTMSRLTEPGSDYYFISLGQTHIGAIRIRKADRAEGRCCKLKQLYILPEFQGNGYAQEAIRLAEALYPEAYRWELDTIMQEAKLCHLYEKMGYRQTGKFQNIKEGMDLVFYAK